MWRMLQTDEPGDYVVATGEAHTVREFAEAAFGALGMSLEWRGEGTQERGVDPETGIERVVVDPSYFRPAEVDILLGDYARAEKELGWRPNVTFAELVRMMAEADLKEAEREVHLQNGGFPTRNASE